MPAPVIPRLTAHKRDAGSEENANTTCAQLTTQASPMNSPGRARPSATGPDAMHEAAPPLRAKASLTPGRRGWRVDPFCRDHGIGRTTFYRLVKEGHLKVHKVGRITLVDADEAERWWASCAKGAR